MCTVCMSLCLGIMTMLSGCALCGFALCGCVWVCTVWVHGCVPGYHEDVCLVVYCVGVHVWVCLGVYCVGAWMCA